MPGQSTLNVCIDSFVIEMDAALRASNQNVKHSSTLNYVFDIKNWIAPHLDEIHGHTAPHVFRFCLNHVKKCTTNIGITNLGSPVEM